MPAPGPRLSPAELASLEQAFASDPGSDTYRPLAEAYLSMGRYMEAMVVSKRGIKSHPDDPVPRLLLARVHLAQHKDEKALEVLGEALQRAPADPAALRLLASIHFRNGARDDAVAALRKAWEAAPKDPETTALATEHGVTLERAIPVVTPRAPSTVPAAEPTIGATRTAPAPAVTAAAPPSEPVARATVPVVGARPAPAAYQPPFETTAEHVLAHKRSRGALVVTGILAVVLALVLAGWGIVSGVQKRRAVEVDRLLRQSRELIEKDAYPAYREAAHLCERVIERDPKALGGHAYLAYVDAIRWGELGEDEALRADAQRQLDRVRSLGRPHSHAYAAQAYLRAWSGDPQGAIAELQQVLKGPEGESPLLRGVLGALELQAGNLDAARDALTWVRQRDPGDVRSAQLLAEQWRRRGAGFEAQANTLYDLVLTRLAPDHVPSLLGKAHLLLDAGEGHEALKRIGRVLDMGDKAAPKQIALARQLQERAKALPAKQASP